MIPGGERSEVPWKQKKSQINKKSLRYRFTAGTIRSKCLAAGMNAHLAKPIKIENIKRILCEYCV